LAFIIASNVDIYLSVSLSFHLSLLEVRVYYAIDIMSKNTYKV